MELPLPKLETGKTATIKRILGGSNLQRKLFSMGLRLGKHIKVVSMHPLMGPLVVEVDRIRVGIGRGMANRIIVEIIK